MAGTAPCATGWRPGSWPTRRSRRRSSGRPGQQRAPGRPGAALFQKLTPGALTLGPVLAATLAHHAAVASFPLGASLGGLWYGLFPIQPSLQLIVGTTGGLMLLAAVSAAFAGVLSDPVQRALGLHQRRLHRLIDALGYELRGDSETAFRVRDHYVARIFDLIDLARATYRPT